MMTESFDQFPRIISLHGGTMLEPPYVVPQDCVAGRFVKNGKVLGVAAFANSEQMQAAVVTLFRLDGDRGEHHISFEAIVRSSEA